jgi:hypothetical protein
MLLVACVVLAVFFASQVNFIVVPDVYLPGVVGAAVLFLASQVFYGWRWRQAYWVIIRHRQPSGGAEKPPTLKTFLGIIFLGSLVSLSILPSFLGQDATKLALYRRLGGEFGAVLGSIILTRITGLIGILIVGFFGIVFLTNSPVWPGLKIRLSQSSLLPAYESQAIFAVAGLILLLIGLSLAYALRKKIQVTYRDMVPLFEFRLFISALASQVLFAVSVAAAIMAVGPIDVFDAFAVSSISLLIRIIPLSIFGVTLGEGVLASLLMALGWNIEASLMSAGLITAFLYLCAGIGFLAELFNQSKALK